MDKILLSDIHLTLLILITYVATIVVYLSIYNLCALCTVNIVWKGWIILLKSHLTMSLRIIWLISLEFLNKKVHECLMLIWAWGYDLIMLSFINYLLNEGIQFNYSLCDHFEMSFLFFPSSSCRIFVFIFSCLFVFVSVFNYFSYFNLFCYFLLFLHKIYLFKLCLKLILSRKIQKYKNILFLDYILSFFLLGLFSNCPLTLANLV